MDVRQRTTAGNWFRYLLRFLGMLGLILGAFGLVFYYTSHTPPERDIFNTVKASATEATTNITIDGVMLLVGLAGAAIAIVWLLLEALMALTLITGKRAVVGGNMYLQIALAVALFVVLNIFAFRHYIRYDCTRDSQFTLNASLVKELQTLSSDSPTDVVVLQMHKRAISRGQEPDNIDKAAELKVVEKVNDLVDQLRELGPRFRVTVLDRQDEYYADKVDKLPEQLRKAMENVPEDSIFFHANDRVRRMSFADFFRIDKTASRTKETVTTPDGKTEERVRTTNLVLLPQGKEEFVERLLSLEQRKPKVGILVIHPLLSSRKVDDAFSAAGMRKTLEANGFTVQDIVIKRWDGSAPTATAQTFDEFELEDKEFDFEYYTLLVQDREEAIKKFREVLPLAKTLPLPEVSRRFRGLVRADIETESERAQLVKAIERQIDVWQRELAEFKSELAIVEPQYTELLKNEKANEGRRTTDATAKLKSAIDGCDLLYIPRLTAMDLSEGRIIPAEYYGMPKEQTEVIRDYIKSGKPVLACFGPTKFGGRGDAEPDDLELLFTQLGFDFGSQTIMTDAEAKASSKTQSEGLGSSPQPPLLRLETDDKSDDANPIRSAYLVASRSVDGTLELRRSGPRSITVSPRAKKASKFNTVILESVAKSWNEDKPVASRGYTPKYDAAKIDDPNKGKPEEERRGPFPLGAAIEIKVPAEWYNDKLTAATTDPAIGAVGGGVGIGVTSMMLDAAAFAPPGTLPERPTVRLVALGHGGIFTGKELSPAQETLLLSTLNWQLKRDELLPKDVTVADRWQFPRVEMTAQQTKLWRMGTILGLPMLCAFVGVVVLMTRRMR